MWTNVFPTPLVNIVADTLYAAEPLSLCDNDLLTQTVSNHHFNRNIQIILPFKLKSKISTERLTVASSVNLIEPNLPLVASMINGTLDSKYRFCLARQVPLHFLVHPKIVKSLIHRGQLLCTSFDNSIVTEDSVALADGVLSLSLTEKSYRKLGIDGTASRLCKKKNPIKKFNVEVDLFSDCMQNTLSKYSKRLRRCFRTSALAFDLLVKWQPDDSTDSIDSFVEFFNRLINDPDETLPMQREAFSLEIHSPEVDHFTNTLSRMPKSMSNISSMDTAEMEKNMELLIEDITDWTGLQLTRCDVVHDEASSDVSSIGFSSESCDPLAFVHCIQLTGLFSPREIEGIFKEVEGNINYLTNHIPFIVVVVHGLTDCVTSWSTKGSEHGSYLTGENLYGLLISSLNCHKENGEAVSGDQECAIVKRGLLWRLSDSYDFALEKM